MAQHRFLSSTDMSSLLRLVNSPRSGSDWNAVAHCRSLLEGLCALCDANTAILEVRTAGIRFSIVLDRTTGTRVKKAKEVNELNSFREMCREQSLRSDRASSDGNAGTSLVVCRKKPFAKREQTLIELLHEQIETWTAVLT